MAATGGQVQAAGAATPGQAAPRTDMAPVLQQLNLASLRTRTQDLHNAISRILHSFHTLPALKWSEVLGQFAMVNVELLNLVEDIKPILKMFVVYPKNVNAENATSTFTASLYFHKLLPLDSTNDLIYLLLIVILHLRVVLLSILILTGGQSFQYKSDYEVQGSRNE